MQHSMIRMSDVRHNDMILWWKSWGCFVRKEDFIWLRRDTHLNISRYVASHCLHKLNSYRAFSLLRIESEKETSEECSWPTKTFFGHLLVTYRRPTSFIYYLVRHTQMSTERPSEKADFISWIMIMWNRSIILREMMMVIGGGGR